LRLWDSRIGEPIQQWDEPLASVATLSADGSLVAAAGKAGLKPLQAADRDGSGRPAVQVFSAKTGETVRVGESMPFLADLRFSPDGRFLGLIRNGVATPWRAYVAPDRFEQTDLTAFGYPAVVRIIDIANGDVIAADAFSATDVPEWNGARLAFSPRSTAAAFWLLRSRTAAQLVRLPVHSTRHPRPE
jgi:hypothetical protein